jgi:CO/xanthine dehydrogenase Mo-binding subunit
MKRRQFLKGGAALVVSFSWGLAWPQSDGEAGKGQGPDAALPGSLKIQPYLDGWIRVDADGAITVMTGKAELGQGIKTALLMLAAEELIVDPERITMLSADTEKTPNEGYTAGSHSMQDSGTAIRMAAAQIRVIFAARAAQHLAVSTDQLHFSDGTISAGQQSVTYQQLLGEDITHVKALPSAAFIQASARTLIGKSYPRIDLPAKVSGGAAYVQDLRLEGMVHARLVRPPSPGATLASLDTGAVLALPGVLKVVQDGRFVAVIAEHEFEAVRAQRVLAAGIRWQPEAAYLWPMEKLYESIRAATREDYLILDKTDPSRSGVTTLSASYLRPYQMHGSIGPSCAVAWLQGDKMTVWSHTQGVFPLRKALAQLLGVEASKVHTIHAEGAGCYGHNGADDAAGDAALCARALPGRPIRLQWSREDEHGWEPLAPPMIADLQASLDASGTIVSWQHEVFSNTHTTRPGGAGDLLGATLLEQPFKPSTPKPIPQPEGGGDRNAVPLYVFPNTRVVHHFVTDMPRRVSAMRGLGAYVNVYAIESFMDEAALVAGVDPVDYRLRHLEDPRARAVVMLAAERFGWRDFKRLQARGRGFAFARYKNLGAYLAIAVEMELWRDTGKARLIRAVCAVDSGEIVSPDGIRNQVEGGVIQSLSWTTLEAVQLDGTHVTSLDWAGYPILRFEDLPESIEVHIVPQPGQPFLGTGEASQGPTAAAIANALADASGTRLRELPFTPARVRAALGVR